MIITVSDTNGIKQYDVPDNIKKIISLIILVVVVIILVLGFYVKTFNDKLNILEEQLKVSQTERASSIHTFLLKDKIDPLQNKSTMVDIPRTSINLLEINRKEKSKKLKYEQEKHEAEAKLKKESLAKLKEEKAKKEVEAKANQLKRKKEKEKKESLAKLKKEVEAKAKRRKLEKKKKLALEKLKREKSKKEALLKRKKAQAKKEAQAKEKRRKLEKKKKLALQKRKKEKRKISTTSSMKKEKLLPQIAKGKLGKRYVWGAVGPKTFDCSGFTSYVYKKTGIVIPRTSRQQSKYGKLVDRKHLKAGDLIFFDTSRSFRGIINHVGMYIGNNKFIHASSAKKCVVITSLNKNFYSKRFKWARRVIN